MTNILESNRQAIAQACRRHGVLRLDAFGSALRDDFRPDASDLDLLVEFVPMEPYNRVDAYFGLLEELRILLGSKDRLIDRHRSIAGNQYAGEAAGLSRAIDQTSPPSKQHTD